MTKNMKSMYKDIINNINLQENIPTFFNNIVDRYHTYASVRLAFHYYTFYEMYCDEKEQWDNTLLEYCSKLNNIISEAVLFSKSGNELEEYVGQVDEIRNQIIARMETISFYTDLFEIYEYALNRVEYRFNEMGQIEDDEEYAKKILNFIFDSEDNVQINEMIKEIIGQLPIRITKQKYYDYIREGLGQLLGAQEDSLETYMYIIRSSAMLDFMEEGSVYPILWEKKEYLEKLNFKDITKEEYEAAIKMVQEAGIFLEIEHTAYYSLMEMVNELYSILVCTPYNGISAADLKKQGTAAMDIISCINGIFIEDKQEEAPQEIFSRFEVLEGFQEEIEFDLFSLEDALYHIDNHHRNLVESLMAEKLLNILLLSKNLLSGSLFIDLHKVESDKVVDKEMLQREIDKFLEDVEKKFKNSDRMIIRAIMANTIKRIPVFFNNHTEVMDYVLYSLNKCTDAAEKYACIEIIDSIMDF